MQGGIKAVVWTDTIQIFIIYGSIVGILIKGTVDLGFDTIWQRNADTDRIEFLKYVLSNLGITSTFIMNNTSNQRNTIPCIFQSTSSY